MIGGVSKRRLGSLRNPQSPTRPDTSILPQYSGRRVASQAQGTSIDAPRAHNFVELIHACARKHLRHSRRQWSVGARATRRARIYSVRTFHSSLLIRTCTHHDIDTAVVLFHNMLLRPILHLYPCHYHPALSSASVPRLLRSCIRLHYRIHVVYPFVPFVTPRRTSLAPPFLLTPPNNVSHARPELHHALMLSLCGWTLLPFAIASVFTFAPLFSCCYAPSSLYHSSPFPPPLVSSITGHLCTVYPRSLFTNNVPHTLAGLRPRSQIRYSRLGTAPQAPSSTSSPVFHA